MPRAKQRLTYDKTHGWWVRRFQKRKYYLVKAPKSDRQAYADALKRFNDIVASSAKAEKSRPRLLAKSPSTQRRTSNRSRQLRTAVSQYLKEFDRRSLIPKEEGGITKGRARGVRYWIGNLQAFFGDEFPLSTINENDIKAYVDALHDARVQQAQNPSEVRKHGKMSGHTLYQMIITLKHFIRWSWQNRYLNDIPRNLVSVKASIPRSQPVVFGWRKREGYEIQRLLQECRRRDKHTYLATLLALNCGMTLKDISDMKAADFKWRASGHPRIKRERSKTKVYGNWVLWDETYRLLMELKTAKDEDYGREDRTLLLLPDEKPIMRESHWGHSPLAYRFRMAVKAVFGNDDNRSFRHLRKTAASYAAFRFLGTETLLLAHTPKTMAARFYVETPHTRLDFVLCAAEVAFGLRKTMKKRYALEDEPLSPKDADRRATAGITPDYADDEEPFR